MASTRADNKSVGEMSRKDLLTLINQALNPVTKSIESLKEEVEGLRNELKEKDAYISELSERLDEYEQRLDEREQYSRRNNLRIFGVKEESHEDTNDLVKDVARKIGVDLLYSNIDRSHRVGRKVAGGKPRPIIVKFIGYGPRNAMFSSKKALKGSKVTIREDLTSQRLNVLNKAIEAYSLKNVWTHDGVILINTGGARPSRARFMKEFEDILRRFPPTKSPPA